MSSLLRSSKFFKYFNSFNRSLIRPINVPVQSSSMIVISRDYANAHPKAATNSNLIDKYMRRLDSDVRRNGRVSSRELLEAIDEIKLSNKMTSTQILMIIRCCGNLLPEESPDVKLKLVEDIWSTLEKQGVPLDISHYNALLIVYLENEHLFSPTEFLATLDKKGIDPNRVTFQRLIAAFCQQGNIEGATRILEFMKEKQMPISENIFNSLIMGHSQTNDIESAKGMFGVMVQANIEPSSETYTALLCGYAKKGDIAGISEVCNLAESKEVVISDKHLLEVIYHLCVNNHVKLVDVITPRLMRQAGYNQDAKNVILRLMARGMDEAAVKVFKTMTPINVVDEEPLPKGTFIIRQMVKMNMAAEKIIAFCEDLKNNKDNDRAIFYAAESALIHKKTELGLKLISAISEIEPVSQHYYWPAIIQYGRAGNHEGIVKTLKQISSDMNQPVPNETLREYVVEYIGPNEKGIIALRQAGITVASAASAVVAYHLNNFDLESAARIASKYRANYNLAIIRRGIIQAHKMKPDINSIIQLVRVILSNINESENFESNENNEELKANSDTADFVLLGVARLVNQNRADNISCLLKGYLEFGIGISQSSALAIQEILSGGDLTPEISNLLTQLTAPELSFVALEKAAPSIKNFSFDKEEAALLQAIEQGGAKEESTDSFKLKLINLYCKQEEYEKAVKIKQELDDKNVEIPIDYLIELLNICVNNENVSQSDAYYRQIMAKTPQPVINELTLVKLANLYITADKFDEALAIFQSNRCEEYEEKEFSYSTTCWRMLTVLADKGQVEKVNQLFNTLKSCNFIIPSNVLLGPLIKVHLVNNDLMSALDKFEECCTLHRSTPWKNELACKLIQSEDPASLQRLTDLSSQIHGEVNSLYDLVLSFIECGRIRQARKILETPGLRTRYSRLSSACLRYQNEGHITHLENLVEVTKDLPHIDRADIYYHLLGSYCGSDEVDKALGLWTQMQEEDVQPTDRFLIKLANLLRKHGKAVPFSVPSSTISDRFHLVQKGSDNTNVLKAFRRAVYNKDLDKALEIKQSLLDAELLMSDRSSLLTLLINNGRLGESTKILTQWLEVGLRPNMKTLNYLINSIAKTGDVNSLNNIGGMMDEALKKFTSFTNRYTHCMVEAGKSDEVLKKLEFDIDNANTPEQLEECRRIFPRGGIFSILNASQDYLPQVEKLAMKYKEKGIIEPLNILWINYFLNKDTKKADDIWPDIKNLERIMYLPILKKSRSEVDLSLVEDLLKKCLETKINIGAIGAIQSCILDILVTMDRIDECSTRLDDILKTVPIENINFSTLKRIKNSFEKQGKLFKYSIPPKRTKYSMGSSSSDSDSDDEVRQKA